MAALVIDPEGRALFIRRAREPAKGKLALPGGFIDGGESAEEALRREIHEEVGLRVGQLEYLGSWPNRYPTPSGEVDVCDLFFEARTENTETKNGVEEVAEIIWMDPKEVRLDDLAFVSMCAAVTTFLKRGTANERK
ncbi:MAG: NUDIX hydrolase [Verrucomicrobiales bacterium]